ALHARTVTLTLRFNDFKTITRNHTLSEPSDLDAVILKALRDLFAAAWDGKRLVRLVGAALSGFSSASGQLDLLDPGRREKLERLARATDGLRDRFGFNKLQLAGSLAHKPIRE
ncbi:MAG: DNA polymerase IV, partial [Candidatus Acidiferrales bacterium]